MSSFDGLSVALSALQAQRVRMDIASQNVANANTEGYTRQRVELEALEPKTYASMHGNPRQIGDGVMVESITRITDQFALNRLRDHEASAAYWKTTNQVMSEAEVRFNEPGDKGLAAIMNKFHAAWGDVANHPSEAGPRAALLQEGKNTAAALRNAAAEVSTQWDQNSQRADSFVHEVNQAAKGVAKLNDDIRMGKILKHPTSELEDKRDLLLTKLTGLAGAKIELENDYEVKVSIGGQVIVQDDKSFDLRAVKPTDIRDAISGTVASFEVSDGASPAVWTATTPIKTGKLGATVNALNTTLTGLMEDYDAVASELATKINALQTGGFNYTDGGTPANLGTIAGTDFFSLSNASDIKVLLTDGNQIAASGVSGQPLNNQQALAAAALATTDGEAVDKWQNLVSTFGIETAGAQMRMHGTEVQRVDAEKALDSVAGVDIDEEMTNLLVTQRAYEAAARVMTAVDEALDLIINRTGRVGL